MAHNLGTAQGTIRLEFDSRGILRARNELGQFVSLSDLADDRVRRADNSFSKFSLTISGLGRALLKATKYITITSVATTALATSGNALVAALAALAPVVGAGLATLPGLALAAASAFVIAKVATIGLGDALKAAAEQDADKFNEALKKLAP